MAQKKEELGQDDKILNLCNEAKKSGQEYMIRFSDTWDEIERQIRCTHPQSWEEKEEWQTKVYIPQQAKKSEIAKSYLNKMLFGNKSNIDILGNEITDNDMAENLINLIQILMRKGNFHLENEFVLQEGIDQGTGFIKILKAGHGKISFTWRSCFKCGIDPEAGHNIQKARFWTDYIVKDIYELIDEANNKDSIYSREAIHQFIDKIEEEANEIKNKKTSTSSNNEKLMTIRAIDNTREIEVPVKYKTVDIDEHWITVPSSKGSEKRVIAVLDEKHILRNDENVYGCIPAFACRVKPRKYDFYGKGYLENTRGLQELSNTCVNLGFDSLKISSMDIVLLDESKVKDASSIKYKPLAVWKMKDINGARIQRQVVSAVGDILTGLNLIDQIDQDASGITRQVQGTPNLGGSGGDETLGEFERKLQLIDQRFLDVGRFIEKDYFLPLVKFIFKIIHNKKLFTQKEVDRLLGMDEADEIVVEDGVSRVAGKKKIPKLNLSELQKEENAVFEDDFKAIGVTEFTDKIKIVESLMKAINLALASPTLTQVAKVDEMFKRLLQLSSIEDPDSMIRTKDEVKQYLEELSGMQQQQNPQPQPNQAGGL